MADECVRVDGVVSLEPGAPALPVRLEIRPEEVSFVTERGQAQVIDPAAIHAIEQADYLLRLQTPSGTVEFGRLGGRHDEAKAALRDARNRALGRALLASEARLHDVFGAERVVGEASAEVEVRLYDTRLSLHPDDGDPTVIEYGDLRSVRFDESSYSTVLEMEHGGSISLGQLGRRSREVPALLRERLLALARWLAAAERQSLGGGTGEPWRDGRSIPLAGLHPDALASLARAAGERAAFLEALLSAQPPLDLRLGLKVLATDGFTEGFPLQIDDEDPGPLRVCAWLWAGHALEVLGEEDRATYVFDPGRATIADLERCLCRIQFRRDPIRLESGAEGAGQYALAIERVSELHDLRGACRGRAIHTTPDAWVASLRGLVSDGAQRGP